MTSKPAQHLTKVALIAAIYTSLSLVLAPLSFGNIQVRIAEALTILAIFSPIGITGVTLGCFITNLIGVLTGVNPLGFLDVFVGTAATLLAGLLSYHLREVRVQHFPLVSFLMPILLNALLIGLELSWVLVPNFTWAIFALFAFEVGVGQTLAVFGLGLPLYQFFKKRPKLLSALDFESASPS